MKITIFVLFVILVIAPPGLWAVDECPNNMRVEDNSGALFGFSIAGIGDIGSATDTVPDGYDDFIVGAYMSNLYQNDSYRGKVVVYSGKDAAVIRTHVGHKGNSQMGFSVSSAGDFDNDQWPDYVVGSPNEQVGGIQFCGRVTVYSGKDGSELMSKTGVPDERMGYSVSGIGKFDGDISIIVGCPKYDEAGLTNRGRIFIYQGPAGDSQYQLKGTKANQQFGIKVSGVGLVNNDTIPDFIVGCYSDTVRVYSGKDWGTVLLTAPASRAISNAGDVNGDNRGDFVVGYPGSNQAIIYSGYKSSYSGQTATEWCTLTNSGSTYLGWEVSDAGLVTNDNVPDVLVTEMGSTSPKVHLFSGADSSLAFTQECGGTSGQWVSITCAGDIDLDGLDNIMVGHPEQSWVEIYSCTDSDGDGIFNLMDNCPYDYNPGQENVDVDDFGDACDLCIDTLNPDLYLHTYNCCPEGWPDRKVGGDANGDGACDVGDAVYTMNYIFKYGPEPVPFPLAADANGDTTVNVGDPVYIIAYVFQGGPEPVNGCPDQGKAVRFELPRNAFANISPVAWISDSYDGENTVFTITSKMDLSAVQLDLACEDGASITNLTPSLQEFSNRSDGRAMVGLLDIKGESSILFGETSILSVAGEAHMIAALGSDENGNVFTISVKPPENNAVLPTNYALFQNHPNPFNPITAIRVAIPAGHEGAVSLKVYSVAGRLVKTIFSGMKPPGVHAFGWDGTNDTGQVVSSGIYFSHFTAGDAKLTKKMILLK
jgi:hypothetical protein